MSKLHILIEVGYDPLDNDPEAVAEDLLAHAIEQGERYTDAPDVSVLAAHWDPSDA